MALLKIILLLSFLYCIIALLYNLKKAYSFSLNKEYSKSKGSIFKGIVYAYTKGMLPSEKESANKHLITYLAGIIFHFGIFVSFAYLIITFININLSRVLLNIIQIIFIISLICGLGLLSKRIIIKLMRQLSCFDDYISNILVLIFLLAALTSLHNQNLLYTYYLIAIILFIYIPIGKIRHCLLFFITRILFGKYFGRRNVFQ